MSQHVTVKVKMTNEKHLVEALKKMGFKPVVHKNPISIKSYGNKKDHKANIVIDKDQAGLTYGDIGFERTKDGYVMHVDHIDQRRLNVDELTKLYSEGLVVEEINNNSQCFLKDREIDENGHIIIRVGFLD